MDDRKNTIAGWALFAGIIALGAALLTGEIFHDDDFDSCTAGDGYCPPYVADASVPDGDVEAEQPIAFYLAQGDATRGESQFAKCQACHAINQGGANGIGPALYNTMGNPIAGHAGYSYSDALAGIGGNWDWDNMSEWLKKPSNFAPGTKMSFAGLPDPQDRADIMLYMNQMGSGIAIPPPPPPVSEDEAAAEDAAADGEAQTAEDTNVELSEDEVEGTGDAGGVDVPEAQ